MSRRTFITSFVLLAIVFVPVFLNPFLFFPIWLICPCCFSVAMFFIVMGSSLNICLQVMDGNLFQLVFYGVIFYGLARVSHKWTLGLSARRAQFITQLMILFVVFAFSFLPVVQVGSWDDNSSSPRNNFWVACYHYFRDS